MPEWGCGIHIYMCMYMQIFAFCTWHMCQVLFFFCCCFFFLHVPPQRVVCFSLNVAKGRKSCCICKLNGAALIWLIPRYQCTGTVCIHCDKVKVSVCTEMTHIYLQSGSHSFHVVVASLFIYLSTFSNSYWNLRATFSCAFKRPPTADRRFHRWWLPFRNQFHAGSFDNNPNYVVVRSKARNQTQLTIIPTKFRCACQ